MDHIVVVGASAAGLAAGEALRKQGYDRRLTFVGSEPHLPYDRPPLSKQVLRGTWDRERTRLRGSDALDRLDAEWRLGRSAVGLDVGDRQLSLSDGEAITFDGLVVATGVTPRQLGGELRGVHVLRTLDDAVKLRDAMIAQGGLVVVGAGFLGAEVAAVARELGLRVTMIDPLSGPMVTQLGAEVAGLFAKLHRTNGVDLRLGVGVAEILGHEGQVSGVLLNNGESIATRTVLVAIGTTPNTRWITDSGLVVSNGVDCNEFCEAGPGIVGAGDVANWYHRGFARRLRIEHRMNATEQGRAAAQTLLGDRVAFSPVPYFWTDQYHVQVQVYGMPSADAELSIVSGDPADDQFAVAYLLNGRTVAGLTWNVPREALKLRQQVLDEMLDNASA